MGKLKIRAQYDNLFGMVFYYYNGIYIGGSKIMADGEFFKCSTLVNFCKTHGLL